MTIDFYCMDLYFMDFIFWSNISSYFLKSWLVHYSNFAVCVGGLLSGWTPLRRATTGFALTTASAVFQRRWCTWRWSWMDQMRKMKMMKIGLLLLNRRTRWSTNWRISGYTNHSTSFICPVYSSYYCRMWIMCMINIKSVLEPSKHSCFVKTFFKFKKGSETIFIPHTVHKITYMLL